MFRTLPPVGGRIAPGAVAASLLQILKGPDGAEVLRRLLTERTGITHWVLTNSGRSSLSVVLMALGTLRPGRDEVIIPAYTSYSVPAAVVKAGLRVRLCDVEMETLGLCPKELERALTARTLCVVPNHLYGVPCRIQEMCKIAQERGVPVVEDAAQALGDTCQGRQVGTFGDATIFSLSRGKSLPAANGGLIGTKSEALYEQCRRMMEGISPERERLANFGLRSAAETALMAMFIRPSLYWLPGSLPFLKLGASIYDPTFSISPMSRFQEELAARLLPNLDTVRAARHEKAERFRRVLSEIRGLHVVWPQKEDVGGFLRLPVLVKDATVRKRILLDLANQGLGATIGYPHPLSEISDLAPHLAGDDNEVPVATKISRQLLTLPTHPWVRDRDIQRIGEVFKMNMVWKSKDRVDGLA